jgi:2-oxo-hept-3-ene-1,7-dioate hydratase
VETWELPAVARGIERQVRAIADLRSRGESVIGWKLGLGAPAVREELGLPGPLVGFLGSAAVLPSGSELRVSGWTQPALEPELAVHVGSGGAPPSAAAPDPDPSIAAVGPAIEIVDIDAPREDLEAVVGGNIYQRHVILGAADPRRAGGDTAGIRGSVARGGDEIVGTDDPTALTGRLDHLTAYVARWLRAMGERLEPGQVIICGSIVPLIFAAPGDEFVYRCDPPGELSVSFVP